MRMVTAAAMIVAGVLSRAGEPVDAPASLHGYGLLPRMTGGAAGDVHLYEFNLFVARAGGGYPTVCRRLGAPPGEPARGDGSYRVEGLPAGRYSLYLNQPDFFASPAVIPEIALPAGGDVRIDIRPHTDASAFCADGRQWTEWAEEWYQTFRALGTSVRGVSWKMAGWGLYAGKATRVSVLRDNGDPDIRRWDELGSAEDPHVASDADEWVRWRSGQIPLTPGERYAVRLRTPGGMALYKRPKAPGTPGAGSAYGADGQPRQFDLHVCVFTDDGTLVTHTNLRPGPGVFHPDLHDVRWGQTFVATGRALAAVDLFAAVADPDATIRWRVRSGGPDGPPVGPAKEGPGAYFASTTKLFAAVFSPAEVPLVPGERYCIDIGAEGGFTPFLRHPEDRSPAGAACRAGVPVPGELSMTIVEYAAPRNGSGDGSAETRKSR